MTAPGNISAVGNITGSYILGNGSQLTGIASSYGNANVVANLAALGSNPVSTTGNITSGNILTGGLISATSTITSAANLTGGNILTAGTVSATGNITGNFFTGNGSQLTGVVSSYGNANVAANLAAFGTNPISTSGNITGGNILGGANVNATTHTGTTVSVTANVTGGNLLTGGLISATGNITGGNINTNNIVGTSVTITSTGTLALVPSGNITVNSKNINNLATPVVDTDAATKAYVDSVAQGLDTKASVVAATTVNITLSGTQTIDGVVLVAADRVLVKNQTLSQNNYRKYS